MLFFTGITVSAQTIIGNLYHGNIKHVKVSYTVSRGFKLTFNGPGTTVADKNAIAAGKFILDADLLFTDAQCKAIGVPNRTGIRQNRYEITKEGNAYVVCIGKDGAGNIIFK